MGQLTTKYDALPPKARAFMDYCFDVLIDNLAAHPDSDKVSCFPPGTGFGNTVVERDRMRRLIVDFIDDDLMKCVYHGADHTISWHIRRSVHDAWITVGLPLEAEPS